MCVQVSCRDNFNLAQNVKGQHRVNVVEGLRLHTDVLSPPEQASLVSIIQGWADLGRQVTSALDLCMHAPDHHGSA